MTNQYDSKNLGQVFTPKDIVEKMINLIQVKEPKLVLEPSSGIGNFYFGLKKKFKKVIGIEIDKRIIHKGGILKSYFETKYKPDVIIGNPPYVEFKNIKDLPNTDFLFYKPNLFYFFIEKALKDLKRNGELIFIVPSNVFTNTSGKLLNKYIYENFSITYWEQVKENVWENASVPTAIVKIVKVKNHPDKLEYYLNNGKILFGKQIKTNMKLEIKVGGASGFNNSLKNGQTEFVNSKTERTGKISKILYEPENWIRPVPTPPKNFTYQIFVNCLTRNENPFYMLKNYEKSKFVNYDASVLCVYTFKDKQSALTLLETLNNYDWEKCSVKKDGRFHFSQSILKAVLI